jgi:hypothetical protein
MPGLQECDHIPLVISLTECHAFDKQVLSFFFVTFSSDRSQCYKSILEWYLGASLGVSSSAQLLTQSLDKQSSDSGYLTLCILKSQSEIIHCIAFVFSETELM